VGWQSWLKRTLAKFHWRSDWTSGKTLGIPPIIGDLLEAILLKNMATFIFFFLIFLRQIGPLFSPPPSPKKNPFVAFYFFPRQVVKIRPKEEGEKRKRKKALVATIPSFAKITLVDPTLQKKKT